MILLLSNEFTCLEKETIVNSIYSVSSSTPVFLDYQRPLNKIAETRSAGKIKKELGQPTSEHERVGMLEPTLSDGNRREKKVCQKCIGDHIVTPNETINNALFSELTKSLEDDFLFEMMMSRRGAQSDSEKLEHVLIVNNVVSGHETKFAKKGAMYVCKKECESGLKNIVINVNDFDSMVAAFNGIHAALKEEEVLNEMKTLTAEKRKNAIRNSILGNTYLPEVERATNGATNEEEWAQAIVEDSEILLNEMDEISQ